MKVKLNDKVIVITGKDKGKVGKIIRVLKKHDKVVVEKTNMRTKHIKKTESRAGEKVVFEAPMSSSNVMILCPETNKPTRIGYKTLANGKKERIAKVSGASLDNTSEKAEATNSKAKKKVKV